MQNDYQKFDVVVIGAGPAGYVAAIKASQLGLNTAIIEKINTFGGTCLNVGCIPSKTLLHATAMLKHAQDDFPKIGIKISKPIVEIEKMMRFKDKTVYDITKGIEFLFKKYKVKSFYGNATIIDQNNIQILNQQKIQNLNANNIIIATGSQHNQIKNINIDEKIILSSTGALELQEIPRHLVIVGAGVIGLEIGSIWARLGAKVTCIEMLDRIIPEIDLETAKAFQRILTKQNIQFIFEHKVNKVDTIEQEVFVHIQNANNADKNVISATHLLVAVGRKPHTKGLGIEQINLQTDNLGRIVVDQKFRTNVKNIYAVGDVTPGPMLAHKAEEEGIAVAEIIAGQYGHVNYNNIPSVIYTKPEVASVGKTEEQLKDANVIYKKGKFYFNANGRAKASQCTEGFVKILSCAKTDRVLGAHIIADNAGEIIAEIVVLMEFGGSSEDLARTVHAHPTMSEAVKEAALTVLQNPIHS